MTIVTVAIECGVYHYHHKERKGEVRIRWEELKLIVCKQWKHLSGKVDIINRQTIRIDS